MFKGKYIVTVHDLTLFFYPGRSRNDLIHKWAYKYIFGSACKKAQEIIAVSEATKSDIVKTFKTPAQKIKVVYEAADDKIFTAPPADLISKIKAQYKIDDTPVLLYVGQWRPHKNLIGLIKAFELLRAKMPAKLAIVGKPDPAFPDVKEIIDKSKFLRDIMVTGFTSDEELSAWYKIASVFVFPSFYEGFGLPGLEAMEAGLPVLASNKTSLPEIYQKAALYFNPDYPKDIQEKIEQVIDDPRLRENLISEGSKLVKKYSWQKTAQETLAVYKQINNN